MTKEPAKTRVEGVDWWTGSNGNLFADHNGFRYCVAHTARGDYSVARNGVEIAKAPTAKGGQIYVARFG